MVVADWADLAPGVRMMIREREIEDIKDEFFSQKVVIPEDNIQEVADVAWQENRRCPGIIIGYILGNDLGNKNKREFIFAYSKKGLEISRAKGFRNLTAFPNTEEIYISRGEFFPAFLTKLPQRARTDLRGKSSDETSLLIEFSRVMTDDFILLPPNYNRESKVKGLNLGAIDTTGDNGIPRIPVPENRAIRRHGGRSIFDD